MNNISKQFQDELKALLKKYDAEIELEETSRGYCSSNYTIKVWAYSKYDNDGNMIQDTIDLDLGKYFNSEST